MTATILVWLSLAAAPAQPVYDDGPTCSWFRQSLAEMVRRAPVYALVSTPQEEGVGAACPGWEQTLVAVRDPSARPAGEGIQLSTVDGRTAAAFGSQREGSGAYRTVALALDLGRGRFRGACISESLVGVRNTYLRPELFDSKRRFEDGRVILWWSVQTARGASNATYVLVPVEYVLDHRTLRLDLTATQSLMRRTADAYLQLAQDPAFRGGTIHRVAAEGLRAFADGTKCR